MIALYRQNIAQILPFIDLATVIARLQYRSDYQPLQEPRKDILQFLDFRLLLDEQLTTGEIKTSDRENDHKEMIIRHQNKQ